MSEYFRLERWEIPPTDGDRGTPAFGGRIPVDDHHRGAGGGLRTGALLTNLDSVGGLMAGVSVLPKWIVTTSLLATVTRLEHRGPLRVSGKILRRGRNAVVAGLEAVDEGADDHPVASVTATFAVLEPAGMDLDFVRPLRVPMPPRRPDAAPPEEFFCIEPGTGPVTRLRLADHLRNPWGILHGGAVAVLADVAACRTVGGKQGSDHLAASDTVLHYLRPARVGPLEARCQVLGGGPGRAVARVALHDTGVGDRLVALGSVAVLDV